MTDTARVVFLGTPEFAVPSLRELIDAPGFDVAGVVTQPDRPAGRGRALQKPPVKEVALAAGLPVIQPRRLHEPDPLEQLRAWAPDFLVVVAFGQILRPAVLDVPRIAPVNVHASLLPRWRGAAPIQHAILAGDVYTGITTMLIDAGLDTGPILLQDSIPIAPDETGQTLHDKLAPLGAIVLLATLAWLRMGSIQPHPQPQNKALITLAPQLTKEDGAIDWSHSAHAIDRRVRAFDPWPGTYTTWNGQRLKILAGQPLTLETRLLPGEVRAAADLFGELPHALLVGTGAGLYAPTRLQLAGRQAVDAADFVRGHPAIIGATLD